MFAGKLDRRIRIERATITRDARNNEVKAWNKLAEVWASKQDVRDSERLASQEMGAEIGTRFQIRWSSDVQDLNPKDRLIFGSRVYEITGVKEVGRMEGIEISAVARPDE